MPMKKGYTIISLPENSVYIKPDSRNSGESTAIGPKACTLARIMQYARVTYSAGSPSLPLLILN